MLVKKYDMLVRLLLVGDTGVGKTCLLCRYTSDEFFEAHISTIGVDFKMKAIEVEGITAKIQIWDTAGQERFESITKQFYRRAQGVLLVYDICNRRSFESIPKWLSYIKEHGNEDAELLLLGNKSDVIDWRQVSHEEGEKFAEKYNMNYFETSAKFDENIDEALLHLCQCIVAKQKKLLGYKITQIGNKQTLQSVDYSDIKQSECENAQLILPENVLGNGERSNCCFLF